MPLAVTCNSDSQFMLYRQKRLVFADRQSKYRSSGGMPAVQYIDQNNPCFTWRLNMLCTIRATCMQQLGHAGVPVLSHTTYALLPSCPGACDTLRTAM